MAITSFDLVRPMVANATVVNKFLKVAQTERPDQLEGMIEADDAYRT